MPFLRRPDELESESLAEAMAAAVREGRVRPTGGEELVSAEDLWRDWAVWYRFCETARSRAKARFLALASSALGSVAPEPAVAEGCGCGTGFLRGRPRPRFLGGEAWG